MKRIAKIKLTLFALLFTFTLIASPHFAFAANDVKTGLGQISTAFPSVSGLNENSTIGDVFVYVIKIALAIAFAVAVVFVIYGGYLYITSGGNEEQATTGRRTVTYAVIGIIIIILSFVIISVIANTVQSGSVGSNSVSNTADLCPDGSPKPPPPNHCP